MFLLLFAALKVAGQTTGYLRYDTVKIMKQNGTCELYVINKTKDSLGILTNVGGGLTSFKRSRQLNDTTIVVGNDTLTIIGRGGGISLTNTGTGFRWVTTPNGSIKSAIYGYGLNGDSTTNAGSITVQADTSETNHLVTQSDLNDGLATKMNISDTANKWVNDIKRSNDSVYALKNGTWQFAYKDSIGGGGSGDIQQVLNVGDTTRRPIMYKWDADTTDDAYVHYSFPSNFGVDYGTFGTGMGFSSGWNRANGVNPSGRPNVVYNLLQYNTTNGGGRINTNEAAFRFGAETNFDLGPGPAFEIHMPEIVTKSGTYLRPMSLYIDKNTGSTAYNYLATGGVLYQTVAGDDLMSFNANGNYNFVGHGSGSTLSLFDESLAGVRYQLQVDGSDIFHNSFGNIQRFDGQIYSAQTTNEPSIYLDDSRTTNNTAGIVMNMNSPNAKRPIYVSGAVTNGMETIFDNTTGSSVIKLTSPTDPVFQTINTSSTDPAGSGYNGAYYYTAAGNGAASGHFGVFYGNSNLGDLDESAIVINGNSLPIILNNSFTEKARLSTGGAWLINRKTAIGTEKLSVNGGVNVNKDNITYRTSTGSRHMLVIDTATGDFERMDVTASGITSINSKTGPAITIQSGTATSIDNSVSNTITVNVTPSSNSIPHTLDAQYTTAGNTGTSETDLFTYTLPANKLSIDGRTANFEIDGEFNDNTITAQLRLYFAGNVTLNTGAVSVSTASKWKLTGYIMRTSSSTAHVAYELQCPGLATTIFLSYSNLTSLDFTTTNVFKISAQAAGGGASNSDITAHSWQLLYKPQPQ